MQSQAGARKRGLVVEYRSGYAGVALQEVRWNWVRRGSSQGCLGAAHEPFGKLA